MRLLNILSLFASLSVALPTAEPDNGLEKRIDQRKFRQGVVTVFQGAKKKISVGLVVFNDLRGALSGTTNSGTNGLIADGISDKILDQGVRVLFSGQEEQYIAPFNDEEILVAFTTSPVNNNAAFDINLVLQDTPAFESVWASALNTLSDVKEKGLEFTMTIQDQFTKGIQQCKVAFEILPRTPGL